MRQPNRNPKFLSREKNSRLSTRNLHRLSLRHKDSAHFPFWWLFLVQRVGHDPSERSGCGGCHFFDEVFPHVRIGWVGLGRLKIDYVAWDDILHATWSNGKLACSWSHNILEEIESQERQTTLRQTVRLNVTHFFTTFNFALSVLSYIVIHITSHLSTFVPPFRRRYP